MIEVVIPNRALFKAAEVCEIAQLQPYVLRSWETEFPDLGIVRGGAGTRMYRRGDVERVLRIKHLLFVEGLTLAGIRRRIEDESVPGADDAPIDELRGRNARERLAAVRHGLQSILDLLTENGSRAVAPPVPLTTTPASLRTRAAGSNGKHETLQKRRGAVAKTSKRRLKH